MMARLSIRPEAGLRVGSRGGALELAPKNRLPVSHLYNFVYVHRSLNLSTSCFQDN